MQVNGVDVELPIIVGTENEKALDISKLREKTKLVTLDPAFMNTASTESAITFIDGDKGILRYRGIPIEQLGENSTFIETAYLLIYGHLPNKAELGKFSHLLTRHSMIHEDMKRFFDGYPIDRAPDGHPLLDGHARSRRSTRRRSTPRPTSSATSPSPA